MHWCTYSTSAYNAMCVDYCQNLMVIIQLKRFKCSVPVASAAVYLSTMVTPSPIISSYSQLVKFVSNLEICLIAHKQQSELTTMLPAAASDHISSQI